MRQEMCQSKLDPRPPPAHCRGCPSPLVEPPSPKRWSSHRNPNAPLESRLAGETLPREVLKELALLMAAAGPVARGAFC